MAHKKKKTFDGVKMKRDIQDKMYAETQNMTFKELKKYITERIKESGLKQVGK